MKMKLVKNLDGMGLILDNKTIVRSIIDTPKKNQVN
jgi:hypothetical protein